jgi:hypothetical protein
LTFLFYFLKIISEKTRKNLEKSGKIWKNLEKSGKIWINLEKSRKIQKNREKSGKIGKNPEKSRKIQKNLEKSVDGCRWTDEESFVENEKNSNFVYFCKNALGTNLQIF